MNIRAFLAQLERDNEFEAIALNNVAQFGTANQPYLGAEILPEQLVLQNAYRENNIRYQTIIALDNTRYGPTQLREGGEITGSFMVELGNSDIKRQFTAEDYDAVTRYLASGMTMDAARRYLGWVDTMINEAMIQVNEKQRWQAIINAQILRQGDNNYQEIVNFLNPTGHRINVGGNWSDNTYDPADDVLAMVEFLKAKGYEVGNIYTSTKVMGILRRNVRVNERIGNVTIVPQPDQTNRRYLPPMADQGVNAWFASLGLPAPRVYDRRYNTQLASYRFMQDNVLVITCITGRSQEIVSTLDPTDVRLLMDTLGYTGVGLPTGMPNPGRTIRSDFFPNKPPRIETEGWQTSLPVIQDPEALAVLKNIQ